MVPIFFSIAETAQNLNNKITEKNNDITKIEQEIKIYQNELNNLGKEKNSLANSIKELDLTKKKLNADISLTQSKIDKVNLTIQGLGSQILNKEDSIANNISAIKINFKKINEIDNYDFIQILLTQNNFTQIWQELDSIVRVKNKTKERINELEQIKGELEDTKDITTTARNELLALKNKLADQRKIVEQNKIEKNKLLNQTKNNEANYQKLLQSRLAQKNAFEKELAEYESQLKFILNPKSLPGKGVLAWPLDSVYVTQLFGITKDSARLYASGSHSGVDFRAAVGTPIKAVADGTVEGTGDTDLTCPYASFGKFIFIKHYNGLATAYGHLSLIKVQKGDKVKKGQIIGYSGNTGHTTGPHLHLTVYVAEAVKMETRPSKACIGKHYTIPIAPTNAYLDPMYYLPSISSKFIKP